jgi:Ser/Thr protein kinase RdoA (MazF antagonist)
VQVDDVRAALLDSGVRGVGDVKPVERGFGNENWLVHTAEGSLLAKVGPSSASVHKWQCGMAASELARAAGVPVPEPIAFVEASALLDGRPFRVFRWIDGQHPSTVIGDAPCRDRFFRQLGEAVARLHRIELPTFTSRINGDAPAFELWSEYLDYRWGEVRARAVGAGIDERLLEEVGARLPPLARSVDRRVRPALCHRDLYLDNLLADRDGNLVAILDFDMAEAWDCAGDFFKLRWWVFERIPMSEGHFLSGYRGTSTLPVDLERRVAVVELIELVNVVANVVASDAPMANAAAQRLERRLDPDR